MPPTPTLERRITPLRDLEIRAASDDQGLRFRGRAIVYGQMSDDLGGWSEIIEPGASTRTLATNPDVRFLRDHDSSMLLGRTTSGTLRLYEDDAGVMVDADLPDVSYARDLAVLLERRDLTQMSFAFWIRADEWAGNVHHVRELDLDGGDVSVVTFPAYPQTSAELRAAAQHVLTPPGPSRLARDRHKVRELELLAQL